MCRVFFSVEELKQHPLNKWRAGEDRYCKVCHHEQFTCICFVPKKMQILRSSNNIVIVLGHGIAYCALLRPTFFELAVYAVKVGLG